MSEDSVFKSKYYFRLDEAVEEVKTELQVGGVTDKAKAGAKLLGKTAFNLAWFAGKVGVQVVKNLPQIAAGAAENLLKNPNLTDEQRSKCESFVEKHKK